MRLDLAIVLSANILDSTRLLTLGLNFVDSHSISSLEGLDSEQRLATFPPCYSELRFESVAML